MKVSPESNNNFETDFEYDKCSRQIVEHGVNLYLVGLLLIMVFMGIMNVSLDSYVILISFVSGGLTKFLKFCE